MKETDLAVLSRAPLFAGVAPAELETLLAGTGRAERFPLGAVVPAVTEEGRRLGVILSGAVTVMGAGDVPLNRISQGGMFGAAALFSEGEGAPTHLIAKKPSEIFFLAEGDVERLTDDPRIRRNLLAFLCDRIRFLNRKVATFSAPDALSKLAMALRERAVDGVVNVEGGMAQLARSLDLGRASLYRAMDRLEKEGTIRRRGRVIEILSESGAKPE